MPDATHRLDRRSLLRATGTAAAIGASAVPVSASGGGSEVRPNGDALVLAYHDAARNLIHRTLVVYGEPARVDRAVCGLADAWRHPVVATGFEDGEASHATLLAGDRLRPGTVAVVVDRVQGCSLAGTEYTGVFLDVIARPPNPGDGDDAGNGSADASGDGTDP